MTAPAPGPDSAAEGPTSTARPHMVPELSRSELVAELRDQAKKALAELGGASALEDLNVLGDAMLDVTSSHPGGLAQFLAGRPTRLSNLVRDPAVLPSARKATRSVRSHAETLTQRTGMSAAFLAIATASWVVDDQQYLMPVLLRPVTIEQLAAGEDERLTLDSAVEVNPALARILRSKGALLDAGSLADSAFSGGRFDVNSPLNRIEALGDAVLDEFTLDRRLILGAFLNPGQQLIDDLDAQVVVLEHHEVIGGLAGDRESQEKLKNPLPPMVATDRDPWEERGVGDLTTQQRHVVDAAATENHFVVDMPAGADSVGTVASMIADAAGSGRSVVYVPGRRSSGQKLVNRLSAYGLDELVLDLPPQPSARRQSLTTLQEDISRIAGGRESTDVDPDERTIEVRAALSATRQKLAHYVDELHWVRAPWNVSAYGALQALGDLTSRGRAPKTRVRLSSETVRNLTDQRRVDVQNELVKAAELGAFTVGPRDTAWYGAGITSADAAKTALEALDDLLHSLVPRARQDAGEIAATTGLKSARTPSQWAQQLTLLASVRQSLDVFLPIVFERSVADLVNATATKQWRVEHDIEMSRSVRRRLRKQAKDMVRPGRPVTDLHAALQEVQKQRRVWQEHCPAGSWPRIPSGMLEIEAQQRKLAESLAVLDQVITSTPDGGGLTDLPWDKLVDRLVKLDRSRDSLKTLPQRTSAITYLRESGLGDLLDDLAHRKVPADRVAHELQLAWWSSVFEDIMRSHPELAQFDGEKLSKLTAEFRELDHAHLRSQILPIRRAHAAHASEKIAKHSDQAVALADDLASQRVASLREALVHYPDVARTLRPCWVVSPAMIPQVLPQGRRVDVVIIDDAHILSTPEVLGAISRARQLIIVGDQARAGETGVAMTDLSEMLPSIHVPGTAIERPTAIAQFLAAHDYLRDPIGLPSPQKPQPPVMHLVDGTGMPTPGESTIESVQVEIEKVVDLVIEHALDHPNLSLAVVTVSKRHAVAVRESVLAEARRSHAVQRLLEPDHGEGFTVCDITEAESLSRDHVILSIGFGKTPHGRVLHQFGPAAQTHGRSQLLATLAGSRKQVTVVSCISAEDLDSERLRSPGTRVLGDILDFAAGAAPDALRFSLPVDPVGSVVEDHESTDDDESEDGEYDPRIAGDASTAQPLPDRLLLDVAERIWRRGYIVEPAYGTPPGPTIPLAIGHPDSPERFSVAVVTDDEDYIAEPSVRTRDRLRQVELEQLGWHVVHVWAAAAFIDPEREVERVERAVLQGQFPEKVHINTVAPHPQASPSVQEAAGNADEVYENPNESSPLETAASSHGNEESRAGLPSRPPVMRGLKINEYGDNELDALSRWIKEAQELDTETEIVAALREDLGLKRRGARVDTALGNAARRALDN